MEGIIMKKGFTALASLAMAITVGGVYATWNFVQNQQADGAQAEQTIKMASEFIDNKRIGTIEVRGVGGIKIDDVDNNYEADITVDGALYFTVKVEPHAGVDLTKAGKDDTPVTLKYEVIVSGVPNEDGTIANFLRCTKEGTISGADLLAGKRIDFETTDIDVGEDGSIDYTVAHDFVFGTQADDKLVLSTVEEYYSYKTLLTSSHPVITIKVTDITEYDQYIAG